MSDRAGPADMKSPPKPAAGEPAPAKPARPSVRPGPKALIGSTISDRYRIEKLLGEGGMGAVYQAEHTLMRKRMAIKVLHPEMTRLPEVVARFEREAMAAAHIDHPHVVTATDFGKLDDGSFFLALEFVEGKSLREVIAQGPLELGRALHIARQIASALGRAHTLKIVHRDLKPENVMLVEREGDPNFVKVLDFGIAKVQIGELTAGAVDAAASPGQPVLTQAGMVYGTPEYMAPEQALGQSVDARADIYALGVIMYEMLTGFRPFEAESKVALLGMQVTAPVPPMAQKAPAANVPPEVEQLVVRCLAKEAAERTAEARDLIDGITAISAQLAASGRIDGRYAPGPTSAAGNFLSTPGAISRISGSDLLPVPSTTSAGDRAVAAPSSPARRAEALLQGKAWIVAAAGGLIGLLVLVAAIVVVVRGRDGDEEVEDAGEVAAVDAGVTSSNDDRVTAAIADIERGNFASGIKELESLRPELKGREDVHRALMKAYAATSRPRDALREAGLLLRANPELDVVKEVALRVQVRDTALLEGQPTADKAAVDEAFRLLEKEMGTVGWDDLYDIAYGKSGVNFAKAAQRAKGELVRGDRSRMSPALAVTVDLHAAGGNCSAIKAQLDRAADKGDERTLLLMKQLTAPRYQGHWKKVDTLGCIHGDKSLDKAIAELDGRLRRR